MSNFEHGQKVKVLGVEGTVKSMAPGTGQGDGVVLVKLPDGTERYVMESYLETLNAPPKKAPPKAAPKPAAAAPVAEEEKPIVKAKAPVKKKAAPKKSAKKKK